MEKSYTVIVKDGKYRWYLNDSIDHNTEKDNEHKVMANNNTQVKTRSRWESTRDFICTFMRGSGFAIISTIVVIKMLLGYGYGYGINNDMIKFYVSNYMGIFSFLLSMTFTAPGKKLMMSIMRRINKPAYICDLSILGACLVGSYVICKQIILTSSCEFIKNDLGNVITWVSLAIFMMQKTWEQN
ncbi:MAG: hypothetical protein IKU20_02120 [Lachnospiraceae bacterium]|nr:hypothetical protein [Lachnospiraceae bacterium]